MKTKLTFILLVLGLFAAPSALARNPDPKRADVDCKAYVNQEVKKANDRIESLKATSNATGKKTADIEKRLDAAEKRIAEQAKEIEALRKWGEEKWNTGKRELEKANAKAKDGSKKSNLALWILVPVVAVVLVVLSFFFWPRKPVSSAVPDAFARPKCPRCGLEHDPGDAVCKNPACKTRF